MSLRTYLGSVLLLAMSLLVAACPGELEDPERFDDASAEPVALCDVATIETAFFPLQCGKSSCHAASNGVAPDLASPGIADRLANKPAGIGVLLVPGEPDRSVIFSKLTSEPPYGSRMPVGAPLSETDIACVRAWIAGLQ